MGGAHSQHALKKWAQEPHPLQPRDKRLLWELVLGTLRWLKRIDHGLSRQIKRYRRLPEEVKILLRLGYHQIIILDRIPPYSAVNESVEVAKRHLPTKYHKFTNAVLRKAARLPYPVVKGDRATEAAACARSHPQWMVERWRKRFGMEETLKLLAANLKPAPYSVWVNIHHTSLNAVRKELKAEGIECRPLRGMQKEMLEILSAVDVVEHPLYRDGFIVPQDVASRLVVMALNPSPGDTVLDACAAPGIKTAQIALQMDNTGRVVACEVNPERYQKLKENTARLGAAVVEAVKGDVVELARWMDDESFDKILVDAPCSDLGTVRRHPEIKWRRTREDVERFSQKQKRILEAVVPKLKRGGELVYSVCSFEEEETVEVVSHITEMFRLEPVPFSELLPEPFSHLGKSGQAFFLPHITNSDGFFIAKLRKR